MCTDAYREALTRDLSSTASSAPASTPGAVAESGPAAPRMIVLNGPPGCGKSTLARMYAEDHPLALNLDIDRIRSLIGRWRDDPHAAGLLAREIALAAARAHLAAGHDVVIPQFLGRLAFLEQAEQVARQAGASFHEIVLLDSKDNAIRRFEQRNPYGSRSRPRGRAGKDRSTRGTPGVVSHV